MKKKGPMARTFNNENVRRIKMLGLPGFILFALHGCWTSFISAEKLLTARPIPKAPPQVRQNVSLLRVCLGLKNILGPCDPKRIGPA